MSWTIAGSMVAIIGVVLLLIGTHRGGRANDAAHDGLARQISGVKADVETVKSDLETVKADVETVKTDVGNLRTEVRDGFKALSDQIAGLGNNADN